MTLTFKSHKTKHPKLLLSIPNCPWVLNGVAYPNEKIIHLKEVNKKIESQKTKLEKQIQKNNELSDNFSKLLENSNIV